MKNVWIIQKRKSATRLVRRLPIDWSYMLKILAEAYTTSAREWDRVQKGASARSSYFANIYMYIYVATRRVYMYINILLLLLLRWWALDVHIISICMYTRCNVMCKKKKLLWMHTYTLYYICNTGEQEERTNGWKRKK